MQTFEKGGYRVRVAVDAADVRAARALRHKAFFGTEGQDSDPFDAQCSQILLEDFGGRLLGCFRLQLLAQSADITKSYAAQFYALEALAGFDGPLLELGRFCVEPALRDPDVLRIAWAALTRYVDENAVKMLFGCVSFAGVTPEPYQDSFALLRARHLAPPPWQPGVKARRVVRFAARAPVRPDLKRALAQMPPLLRSYLAMGGWVSDHAVVDAHLGTLHVFTGLEVGAIPPARQRLLRSLAA